MLGIAQGGRAEILARAKKSARYWRLRGVALSEAPWMQALEIEMRGSIGGPDLTTGKTATASTEYPGLGAPRGIDDDVGTMWSTDGVTVTPGGEWFMVDFGTAVSIVEIAYTSRSDATRREPTDMVLECSANGVKFYPVKEWTGLAFAPSETKVLH